MGYWSISRSSHDVKESLWWQQRHEKDVFWRIGRCTVVWRRRWWLLTPFATRWRVFTRSTVCVECSETPWILEHDYLVFKLPSSVQTKPGNIDGSPWFVCTMQRFPWFYILRGFSKDDRSDVEVFMLHPCINSSWNSNVLWSRGVNFTSSSGPVYFYSVYCSTHTGVGIGSFCSMTLTAF